LSYLVCTIDESVNKVGNSFYDLIGSFLLPCLLMFIFYLLMLHKLLTKDNRVQGQRNADGLKQVTQTVVTVVVVYFVCLLPSRLIVIFSVSLSLADAVKLHHS